MTIGEVSEPLETVDYRNMSEEERAVYAFRLGQTVFNGAAGNQLLNGLSLHSRLRVSEDGRNWREVDTWTIGGEGEQFADNTEGKAATCQKYHMDSDQAVRVHGLNKVAGGNPDDPRGWTGGVFYQARVEIEGVAYRLDIVVASSGVQGEYDRMFGYTVATAYAALWALNLKAKHGA